MSFPYQDLEDLKFEIDERDLRIPTDDDVDILFDSFELDGRTVPNSLCANPMESRSVDEDGGPGRLAERRYRKLACGGSGVIWVEATAVNEEGRSAPNQMILNGDTSERFEELVATIREEATGPNGNGQNPLLVLQLTHSGRQSAPRGDPRPIVTHRSEIYNSQETSGRYRILSDEEIDYLQEEFISSAKLAADCGFDAVDVKACHGYLLHELLFSYKREDSKYGGSFENRTRFLREVVDRIGDEVPSLELASRLNVFDGVPYPWGWGMKDDGSLNPDPEEPVRLIKELRDLGVEMINLAIGNPYYNPYLERPYDSPPVGEDLPEEDPLESISKNVEVTAMIGESVSDVHLIGTGLSWLRELFPYVASAMKKKGWIDSIGVGRIALANPSYANELISEERLRR